ncbi:MAG: DUF3850 domain-containing protein [Spirochaetota bacterium]|nr:DUF3850 domain-containing protein [Spirochaetota bacterium]
MSKKHHYLKTETEYYQAIECGKKKFELRKNDRDFRQYDILYLEEVVNGVKTGRSLPPVEIKYMLKDCAKYGLRDGYCILNW